MKITDNKKFRNLKISKQKYKARSKKENQIGEYTGYRDKNNNQILNGSIVIVDNYRCIVLWDIYRDTFSCVYGYEGYGSKYEYDSYGKIQYCFPKRQNRLMNVEVI